MAKSPASSEPSPSMIETSVSRWAHFITDFRTLSVVAVALIAAVFYAGVNFQSLATQLTQKLALLDQHNKLLTDGTFVKRDEFQAVAAQAGAASQEIASGSLLKSASLKDWIGEATTAPRTGLGGGTDYAASMCPNGQYAVGFVAHGSTGDVKYCIGCLVSVQAICRPLVAASAGK